jgi:hypothetical protein
METMSTMTAMTTTITEKGMLTVDPSADLPATQPWGIESTSSHVRVYQSLASHEGKCKNIDFKV